MSVSVSPTDAVAIAIMGSGGAGAITAADTDALRCYCEAVVRHNETANALARTGYLVQSRDGGWVKSPLNQLVRDNAEQVRALARELGLTPAARAGIKVTDGATKPEDDIEAFFRRRTG